MLFYIPTKAPKCINHARHKTLWTEGESLKNPSDIIFSFDMYTNDWTKNIEWPMVSQISLFYPENFQSMATFWLQKLEKVDICFTISYLHTCQSDLHRPYFYLQIDIVIGGRANIITGDNFQHRFNSNHDPSQDLNIQEQLVNLKICKSGHWVHFRTL